ncbi:MAG: 50S ribosomal protein L4 [Gammaproteobacteria bacterium]|nr:50S ribosomal protein L4 [Gammaproteobacteria bacterium]
MELQLQSGDTGAVVGSVAVSEQLFNAKYNEPLVHQVVMAYLAAGRSGTKAQKSRAQVRGGGRKPWKQKGTGNARAGSSRSPLWRGGGVTFAAVPRDYAQKVNRRMYAGALRSILSELARTGRLKIVDALVMQMPKTKALIERLKVLGLEAGLIVVDGEERNLDLASRNLPHVEVTGARGLDPVRLIEHQTVVMTQGALKLVEARLA